MKKLLASTFLSATVAGTAFASGPTVIVEPPVAPPPHVMYDWSGIHAGVVLGAPLGENNWGETSVNAESTPASWSGEIAGLTLGFNRQRGNIVFGAAIDYSFTDINAVSTTSGLFNCATGCVTTVSDLYTVRGRVGRAMDRTLVYATAGFAGGSVQGSGVGGVPVTGTGNLTGWTAGVGVERAVNDRFSIFVEYLYTDLGRLQLPASCVTNCFTDVTFGTVRFGGNIHW